LRRGQFLVFCFALLLVGAGAGLAIAKRVSSDTARTGDQKVASSAADAVETMLPTSDVTVKSHVPERQACAERSSNIWRCRFRVRGSRGADHGTCRQKVDLTYGHRHLEKLSFVKKPRCKGSS
jgi:hypothetical protein